MLKTTAVLALAFLAQSEGAEHRLRKAGAKFDSVTDSVGSIGSLGSIFDNPATSSASTSVFDSTSLSAFDNNRQEHPSYAQARKMISKSKTYQQMLKDFQRAQTEQFKTKTTTSHTAAKKPGKFIRALGWMADVATNLYAPELMHLDNNNKQGGGGTTTATTRSYSIPKPVASNYGRDNLAVQFIIPSSIKAGEMFPVRGPIRRDRRPGRHGHVYREWNEYTAQGRGGAAAVMAFHILPDELKLNHMDGYSARVRRDCGNNFCVLKDGNIQP